MHLLLHHRAPGATSIRSQASVLRGWSRWRRSGVHGGGDDIGGPTANMYACVARPEVRSAGASPASTQTRVARHGPVFLELMRQARHVQGCAKRWWQRIRMDRRAPGRRGRTTRHWWHLRWRRSTSMRGSGENEETRQHRLRGVHESVPARLASGEAKQYVVLYHREPRLRSRGDD